MSTPKKVKKSQLGSMGSQMSKLQGSRKVKTMNSSLKGAGKAVTGNKINTKGPAMGKASIVLLGDGTYSASVKCLNGDPRRNLETSIPKGTMLASGKPLPEKGEVTVLLLDGLSIDTTSIFPWDSRQDPAMSRLGGIGKGTMHEGAQDPGRTGPPVPITWPRVETEWVNGAVYRVSIYTNDTGGQVFYPDDTVFIYYIKDDAGENIIKVMVKAEGDCLNLGQGSIVTAAKDGVSDE